MKLLKIDTSYPTTYLNNKKLEHQDAIRKMSYQEYHNWILSLKLTFSDFYTYNLSLIGWETNLFFFDDDTYTEKASRYYFGRFFRIIKLYHRLRNLVSVISVPYTERVLEHAIRSLKPDVIFIREGIQIRTDFWYQFHNTSLLVDRVDCKVGKRWSPLAFDLIYTNIPSYKAYFENLQIPCLTNSNGFDTRLLNLVSKSDGISYEVTYVGGLGKPLFKKRTEFLEKVLEKVGQNFSFHWWGDKLGIDFDKDYPLLNKSYMGHTGGIEMFQIYANSKIVFNDYGDVASNLGVNMRIFEAMGIGALLLTRESKNLEGWNDYLVTFTSVEECCQKIIYYLSNESARIAIATKGQKYILDNYSYSQLMKKLSQELKEAYNSKFSKINPNALR